MRRPAAASPDSRDGAITSPYGGSDTAAVRRTSSPPWRPSTPPRSAMSWTGSGSWPASRPRRSARPPRRRPRPRDRRRGPRRRRRHDRRPPPAAAARRARRSRRPTDKGALVHRLSGRAWRSYVAHTNADVADPGRLRRARRAGSACDRRPCRCAPRGPRSRAGSARCAAAADPGRFADAWRPRAPADDGWGHPRRRRPRRAWSAPWRSAAAPVTTSWSTRARPGVDAYLTADLRHHPASEHLAGGGPALLDAAHWATERPWLATPGRRARRRRGRLRCRDRVSAPRHRPVDRRRPRHTDRRADKEVRREGRPAGPAPPARPAGDRHRARPARHRRRNLPELAELDRLARSCPRWRTSGSARPGRRRRPRPRHRPAGEGRRAGARPRGQRTRSGSTPAPARARELEALQHELASLNRRQGELEDAELELMEQREAAQADSTSVETRLAATPGPAASPRPRARRRAAEIDEEPRRARRRAAAARRRPAGATWSRSTRRSASRTGGIGAAAAARRPLRGLPAGARPVELDRHPRRPPADEVVRCEECRRILVRTAESGL